MLDDAFSENELNHWVNNLHNPTVIKLANAGHFPAEVAPEAFVKELQGK